MAHDLMPLRGKPTSINRPETIRQAQELRGEMI